MILNALVKLDLGVQLCSLGKERESREKVDRIGIWEFRCVRLV